MKRLTAYLSVVLLLMVLSDCGATVKMIQAKSQSERADVSREIPGGASIPAGYADLAIKASIKTHVEGYYGDEPNDSAHARNTFRSCST